MGFAYTTDQGMIGRASLARWGLRQNELIWWRRRADMVLLLCSLRMERRVEIVREGEGKAICSTYIRPPLLRTHSARLAIIRVSGAFFLEHCIILEFSTLSLLLPLFTLPVLPCLLNHTPSPRPPSSLKPSIHRLTHISSNPNKYRKHATRRGTYLS